MCGTSEHWNGSRRSDAEQPRIPRQRIVSAGFPRRVCGRSGIMDSMLSLQRTLSLGYLGRHWTRTALVVASIALGVAALVATRSLNQCLGKAAQAATNPLSNLADLLVVNG